MPPDTDDYQGPDFYDRDGYNAAGFDADGFDVNGYDKNGYDEAGYDSGGNPRSISSEDMDLHDLWEGFQRTHPRGSVTESRREFRLYLRGITRDPDDIDAVVFCIMKSCGLPEWEDETFPARGNRDRHLCESCADSWTTCDRCEDRYPDDEVTTVLGGDDICDDCRANYYSWCENCDGYYPDDDASEHDHDSYDTCCCGSPQEEFTVRNDGCEPLANDTLVTVTLPAGTISAEGLAEIRSVLAGTSYALACDLAPLGDQWQTKLGNYTKRLSSYAYKTRHIKIPAEVMSLIGCLARDHSQPVDLTIEVTRMLNQPPREFCNEDSCWWTDYSASRCALKTNGGLGLRAFDEHGDVAGRAWVMPLKHPEGGRSLVPTFETLTPAAFIVFNGYETLSGYAAPRVLAHMTGWTYRKVGFRCSPMYVNAGGFLVGPEEIVRQYENGELILSVRQHSSLFGDEQAEKAARDRIRQEARQGIIPLF
jgi:hypothetical protein